MRGVQQGIIFKEPVPNQVKMVRRLDNRYIFYGEKGHNTITCTKFKCMNCGQNGYAAKNCPNPRILQAHEMTVAEAEESKTGKE